MRAAFGLILVLGLGACSSFDAPKAAGAIMAAPGQIKAEVARRRSGKQPPVTVTPGMMKATKQAALQVNPLSLGSSDFLKRVTRRTDDQRGTVAVWRTSANAQLFLRDGVLIGSRGLGGDILSSDVSVALQAFSEGGNGAGERRYVISRGDHATAEILLQCVYQPLGASKTQVVDRVYDTLHVRESCRGDKIRITNEYWVQPTGGIMRKSLQWAGPSVGYFEIILLKN